MRRSALLEPQDAREAYSRGLEYLDYNEPDQAIAAFGEAIRLNPGHVQAYFARGCAVVEERRRTREKAVADYNQALRPRSELCGRLLQPGHRPSGLRRPRLAEEDLARYARLLAKAS